MFVCRGNLGKSLANIIKAPIPIIRFILHTFFLVLIIVYFSYLVWEVFIQLPPAFEKKYGSLDYYLYESKIMLLFGATALYSYWKVGSVGPGLLRDFISHAGHEIIIDTELESLGGNDEENPCQTQSGKSSAFDMDFNITGEIKHCDECNIPKRYRAHHCIICQQCVIRMDHHCRTIAIYSKLGSEHVLDIII